MVRRITPVGARLPYYFTWVAIYKGGRREPQYDDRGRIWQISKAGDEDFKGLEAVELFVHPAFVMAAPPITVTVRGRFEVEYQCRKPLATNGGPSRDYVKQQVVLRCPALGLEVVGTPDDFHDTGATPDPGWGFEVRLQEEITRCPSPNLVKNGLPSA